MSTRLDLILTDARSFMATIATSRDAAVLFKEHVTNLPFKTSPMAGGDGFEVLSEMPRMTGGFGVSQEEEEQFTMVIRLGHSPYGTDKERENNLHRDRKRIADLVEAHIFPVGTQVVLYESCIIDKTLANWWVTDMLFKVVYFSAVEVA